LTLHLKTGYWQAALYLRNKEKTPFYEYIGDGLWKVLLMKPARYNWMMRLLSAGLSMSGFITC
jgi:hypothetical protein